MSCDIGEVTESLQNQNELWRRWSDKAWRMSRTHSPSFQSRHLCHSSFWFSKLSITSPMSQLILQPFPRFTYITTHSPTLPLLHLRHSSFSNPFLCSFYNLLVISPTSQLILQPFFRFSTSQALHLIHLASHPWYGGRKLAGRPRNRWEDMVQKDATILLRVWNWREMARTREEWRGRIWEAMAGKLAEAPWWWFLVMSIGEFLHKLVLSLQLVARH